MFGQKTIQELIFGPEGKLVIGIRGRARLALFGALASICISVPAQAQRCWNQGLVEAAQIKEFDIMLLVATLRCQAQGTDLSAGYNAFVVAHRPLLKAVGAEMLQEFSRTSGAKVGPKAYDRLNVVMANKFGNGFAGFGCPEYQAMIAEARAAPSKRGELLTLAQRAGADPQLPVPRCAQTVAAATPITRKSAAGLSTASNGK